MHYALLVVMGLGIWVTSRASAKEGRLRRLRSERLVLGPAGRKIRSGRVRCGRSPAWEFGGGMEKASKGFVHVTEGSQDTRVRAIVEGVSPLGRHWGWLGASRRNTTLCPWRVRQWVRVRRTLIVSGSAVAAGHCDLCKPAIRLPAGRPETSHGGGQLAGCQLRPVRLSSAPSSVCTVTPTNRPKAPDTGDLTAAKGNGAP